MDEGGRVIRKSKKKEEKEKENCQWKENIKQGKSRMDESGAVYRKRKSKKKQDEEKEKENEEVGKYQDHHHY